MLEKVPNDAYDAGDFLAGGARLIDCIRQAAYETGLLERAPGHRGLLTVANEAEARGQRRRTERFENLGTAAEGGTRELVLVERLVGDARSVAVRLLAECRELVRELALAGNDLALPAIDEVESLHELRLEEPRYVSVDDLGIVLDDDLVLLDKCGIALGLVFQLTCRLELVDGVVHLLE